MEMLRNPGVGAACAGGIAVAGGARDSWASNLPQPIPVSEPPMLVPGGPGTSVSGDPSRSQSPSSRPS